MNPKNHQDALDFAEKATIRNGIMEFPILWIKDSKSVLRYWRLFCGIESPAGRTNVTQGLIDRGDLPDSAYGIYWTESGVKDTTKPIVSEKRQVRSGKNAGKKNYTTAFTQTLLDARSDYNAKIRKGAVEDSNQLSDDNVTFESLMRRNRPYAWRVYAMAVHDVNKSNNWKHIKFPCYIQPKLDGTMFIVVFHPDLPEPNHMDYYSRGLKDYGGQDHILAELHPALQSRPGLHVVGELWSPGYGLQEISGISRRIKTESVYKLNFNIFDCFYIDDSAPFEDRNQLIDDLMSDIQGKWVKKVNCFVVQNKAELMERYNEFLEQKYEGGVIRNTDSLYEVGIDKELRSYTTLKIKPRPDAEWPVVGFKEGQGKEAGAVIWICAESDEGVQARTQTDIPLEERKTFAVTPNMDYSRRYSIFSRLTEDPEIFKRLRGQFVVIGYSILSKDQLPQQPKMLRFRDPDVDSFVNEL